MSTVTVHDHAGWDTFTEDEYNLSLSYILSININSTLSYSLIYSRNSRRLAFAVDWVYLCVYVITHMASESRSFASFFNLFIIFFPFLLYHLTRIYMSKIISYISSIKVSKMPIKIKCIFFFFLIFISSAIDTQCIINFIYTCLCVF